jgi:hypothetical protein
MLTPSEQCICACIVPVSARPEHVEDQRERLVCACILSGVAHAESLENRSERRVCACIVPVAGMAFFPLFLYRVIYPFLSL